jgi:hypothetical protein
MVESAASGGVVLSEVTQKAERIVLDFATWRAHLAAPGSTFPPSPWAAPRIIRLDPRTRAMESAEVERRTA